MSTCTAHKVRQKGGKFDYWFLKCLVCGKWHITFEEVGTKKAQSIEKWFTEEELKAFALVAPYISKIIAGSLTEPGIVEWLIGALDKKEENK